MTEQDKQRAEEHWQFLEPLLPELVPKQKVKHLYIEAMMHGAKHARKQKETTK